ncbi:MAG: methyltransferase domain-containing protein [Holosporales bacterium]
MRLPRLVLSSVAANAPAIVQGVIPAEVLAVRWHEDTGIVLDVLASGVIVPLYRCDITGVDFFSKQAVAGQEKVLAYRADVPLGEWEQEQAAKAIPSASVVALIADNETPIFRAACDAKKCTVADTDKLADVVVLLGVLAQTSEPSRLLEEALSHLRPGGLLVISVPNHGGWRADDNEVTSFPPLQMSRWTAAGLKKLAHIFSLEVLNIQHDCLEQEDVWSFLVTLGRRRGLGWVLCKPWRWLAARVLRHGGRRWISGRGLLAVYRRKV